MKLIKLDDDFPKKKLKVVFEQKLIEYTRLRKELYRMRSIEKSIIQYAPEVLMKTDYFLLSFFSLKNIYFISPNHENFYK